MSGYFNFLADATCSDPGEVRNAVRTGHQAPYTLNSRVTYTCNICYSGQGTITCRSNGQWGRKPTCTGKCTTCQVIVIVGRGRIRQVSMIVGQMRVIVGPIYKAGAKAKNIKVNI